VKFSILMPSFNYRRFVESAVDSVLSQEGDFEVELIVADGDSTDGTVEYLARRSDRGLDLISEPDRGQSDALNKALARASGEVVGWLNADDYYLPGAFEAVARTLSDQPDADVVQGDACFVDEHGKITRLLAGYAASEVALRYRGCATFYRRSALVDWQFDTELRFIMDWDLFLHLRGNGAVWAHVRRPTAAFRVHGAQVTATPINPALREHERVTARYELPRRNRLTSLRGVLSHRIEKVRAGSYSAERRALMCRGKMLTPTGESPGWTCLLDRYGKRLDQVRISHSNQPAIGPLKPQSKSA
jgi:glycosyltransferase involved in cell wall biosynthesis